MECSKLPINDSTWDDKHPKADNSEDPIDSVLTVGIGSALKTNAFGVENLLDWLIAT